MESLLRPNQVDALQEEKRRLQGMLGETSPHVANAMNRGDLTTQLRQTLRQLEIQSPKPIPTEEKDAAVKLEASYRESWLEGMATQAEMRRNPAGGVDKHRGWEGRKKKDVLKWKNLRLRMHATGMLDMLKDSSDVANIELYRPVGGPQELNMVGEQIAGTDIHLPPHIEIRNVMSDEAREAAEYNSPMAILERQAADGDVQAKRILTSVTRQVEKEGDPATEAVKEN